MTWPTCDKCGNSWDELMAMLTNCPKCGADIPDAPMHEQNKTPDKQETPVSHRRHDDAKSQFRTHQRAALSARGEGWIPISERLPEHTDTVLFLSQGIYKLGHYAAEEWWDNAEPEWPPALNVTHWMPLPKKPSYVKVQSSDGA